MGLGATEPLWGQTKVSGAEAKEHEDLLSAKRVTDVPSNLQMRAVYDSSSNPTYIGFAPKGLAEASDGWLLHQNTWVSGNCTKRLIAYGSWTNYLTADYS